MITTRFASHPSNDRRLTRMNLGLVVSHDALHFRRPVPDFPLVDASEIDYGDANAASCHFGRSVANGLYRSDQQWARLTWCGHARMLCTCQR